MCGISGTINYEMETASLMRAALQHRGKDDTELVFAQPNVIMSHNRLAIIDPSKAGHQPMGTERYVMVANAEIYNFKDLGPGTNDCQVLLNYIEKVGLAQALKSINGMYAFALFDRVEQKLHLVVDRLGQKPLYYCAEEFVGMAAHDFRFAFASSPAALFCTRKSWDLNRSALRRYWALGSITGEDSIFNGIKKVRAGHHVTIDVAGGRIRDERYWWPQFIENAEGGGIEDLIIDAIEKVQVSDVPVYLFLSGGVDSTLIASRMKGKEAIHLESPEEEYARGVAREFKMNFTRVIASDIDVLECLRDYHAKSGEPSMAALIPYVTAKQASRLCKVAISANGADELFFGYDRISDDVTAVQISNMFRQQFSKENNYEEFGYEELGMESYGMDPRFRLGRWLELQAYVQYDLNKTLDFAAMAHTVEVRNPFLDHRLVEMALSINLMNQTSGVFKRKHILKSMLSKMGFSLDFLNRPKVGFSLHTPPANIESLKDIAVEWCEKNDFLQIDYNCSKRDILYLRASALGFYSWYQTWML